MLWPAASTEPHCLINQPIGETWTPFRNRSALKRSTAHRAIFVAGIQEEKVQAKSRGQEGSRTTAASALSLSDQASEPTFPASVCDQPGHSSRTAVLASSNRMRSCALLGRGAGTNIRISPVNGTSSSSPSRQPTNRGNSSSPPTTAVGPSEMEAASSKGPPSSPHVSGSAAQSPDTSLAKPVSLPGPIGWSKSPSARPTESVPLLKDNVQQERSSVIQCLQSTLSTRETSAMQGNSDSHNDERHNGGSSASKGWMQRNADVVVKAPRESMSEVSILTEAQLVSQRASYSPDPSPPPRPNLRSPCQLMPCVMARLLACGQFHSARMSMRAATLPLTRRKAV